MIGTMIMRLIGLIGNKTRGRYIDLHPTLAYSGLVDLRLAQFSSCRSVYFMAFVQLDYKVDRYRVKISLWPCFIAHLTLDVETDR